MITLSRVPSVSFLDILRRYTPATLAIYALCGYVVLVSLYNVGLAIDVRIAGAGITLPGDTADPLYELGTRSVFGDFCCLG